MKKIQPFALLWCVCTIVSCLSCESGEPKPTKSAEKTITPSSTISQQSTDREPKPDASAMVTETKPFQAKDMLYAWVDKLNIRDTPKLSGKVVTNVQSDDALAFTGEKSDQIETIVLRGVIYEGPWVKVIAPDKKEGWVFEGAVRRKGEKKGNAAISDTQFDFPHFGNFDLATWKKQPSKNESGGDAESLITAYQKGNQILEITKTEVGEYGYSRSYKLMDTNNKVLKERDLNFTADAEFRELTETVKDYTATPPKLFTRTQKPKKHFMQMKSKPEMVNGAWTESAMAADATKAVE